MSKVETVATTHHPQGVASRMDPALLATLAAMRDVTARLFGTRDTRGTNDPVEYAELAREARALLPAGKVALAHMDEGGRVRPG